MFLKGSLLAYAVFRTKVLDSQTTTCCNIDDQIMRHNQTMWYGLAQTLPAIFVSVVGLGDIDIRRTGLVLPKVGCAERYVMHAVLT